MTTSEHPPLLPPTLSTDRLRLRPLGDADAGDLFALHGSAEVLRYWDGPPWADPARAQEFLDRCRRMVSGGTGMRVAVERASDGAFLGLVTADKSPAKAQALLNKIAAR
jgi:RimJ/RimL family protein N-acetyltransferase